MNDFQDHQRTWATMTSTVLHGAIGAAILFAQLTREVPPVRPTGATVMNVMAVPVLPPASAPVRAAAAPAPEPPKPQPKSKSELPPLKSIESPPPTAASLTIPAPDPDATPIADPPLSAEIPDVLTARRDASIAPAPPHPPQAAPTEGNAPGPASAAEPTWEGMVLAALERQKRYPASSQRRREQDVVYVRLTLDREGRVIASRIHKSRQYPDLDAEALDLVRRASPLPKPPASIQGERIDLVVPIEFFLTRLQR